MCSLYYIFINARRPAYVDAAMASREVETLCEHAVHIVPWVLISSVLLVGGLSACLLMNAMRRTHKMI